MLDGAICQVSVFVMKGCEFPWRNEASMDHICEVRGKLEFPSNAEVQVLMKRLIVC